MNNLLDVIVFQTAFSWVFLVIVLLVIMAVPRLFGLNYLTGLIFAQMTLFFNAVPIISGLDTQAIDIGRGIHFFIIEFSFLALVFAAYRQLLVHRVRILMASRTLFDGRGTFYLSAFVVAMAIFNYLLTPTDGSSRIEYMTDAWFSLFKPMIQIATPLSYFGVFLLLLNSKRRFLGYLLLIVVIGGNVALGSKASFVFGLITAFLALRDLIGTTQLPIRYRDGWKLLFFITISIIFALGRLDVSIGNILDRFFLFSDATILTYFSDHPTAACENVSTFASMHRGWARLLGDSSAVNIDTLFGFALTIQELGVNTYTGPNARLSAYILCNFSDERIILGAFVVVIYIWLMALLVKGLLSRPMLLAMIYPYLVTSLGIASQDFNLIMQDITIFVGLILAVLFLNSIKTKPSFE